MHRSMILRTAGSATVLQMLRVTQNQLANPAAHTRKPAGHLVIGLELKRRSQTVTQGYSVLQQAVAAFKM
jgi:hypothetical protein